MGKQKNNFGNKWTRKKARMAIPLFASFFLAQFPLPAGNSHIGTKNKKPIVAPSNNALRFVKFELDLYKIYEDARLEQAGLNLDVFNKAMVGYFNLLSEGKISDKKVLTIADFDKHSSEKRLWVIDLDARKILRHSLVAHGKNSGWSKADKFSNVPQSEMSSVGFYVTQDTYQGKHGLSLKMEGMDEDFNSNAAERYVVMHGAEYVSDGFIKEHGYLGRSQGCPALPMDVYEEIIETVKDRTVLYLHASDANLESQYLNTKAAMESYFANESNIVDYSQQTAAI